MSDQERIEVIRRTVEDCIKYSRSSCTWGHEADIKFMLERYDALAAELAETKALWHERSGTVRLHEIRIRALETDVEQITEQYRLLAADLAHKEAYYAQFTLTPKPTEAETKGEQG